MLGGGTLGALTDVSSLLGIPSNAENEVQILQSRSLMTTVVNRLQLNIVTYRAGLFKGVELFKKNAPFTINIHYKSDSVDTRKYNIKIDGDNIHFTNSKDNVNITTKFGSLISLRQYDIVLTKTDNPVTTSDYSIQIQSVESTVEDLSHNYNANIADKQATAIDLTFKYKHPAKGEAILHELMKQYLVDNLSNKVQIADSTMSFIDRRLGLVGQQLTDVESVFINNFSLRAFY